MIDDVVEEDVAGDADALTDPLLPASGVSLLSPGAFASGVGGKGSGAGKVGAQAGVAGSGAGKVGAGAGVAAGGGDRELTTSTMSAEKWALHLERMLPKLAFKLQAGGKEWVTRLDQAQLHRAALAGNVADPSALLSKLGKEARQGAERLQAREQRLNAELAQGVGAQVREARLRLQRLKEDERRLTVSVSELSQRLATQASAVEELKAQATDRNSTMTDTAPLRRLQQALQQVRADVDGMEVRIGVLTQTLLQANVRAIAVKTREEADARAAASAGKGSGALSLSKKV